MSPVSHVRDHGHVTKVTHGTSGAVSVPTVTGGLLEAEASFVKEVKSFAQFSVSTQCTFLLVRCFIDPTFCGIFVCDPLQYVNLQSTISFSLV